MGWNAGCGCTYRVPEDTGSVQVCVSIMHVNGTRSTTSDYEVEISTSSGSAVGK